MTRGRPRGPQAPSGESIGRGARRSGKGKGGGTGKGSSSSTGIMSTSRVTARGPLLHKHSRGALLAEWNFPIHRNFKGYLQASSGYGETLLDYNHRQTTFGLGISIVDWQ